MKYSTYSPSTQKALKTIRSHFGKNITWEDVTSRSYQIARKTEKDLDLFVTELYSDFLWLYRKIDHYFLSDGLADFLISAVKGLNEDYFKSLPECQMVDRPSHDCRWAMQGLVCDYDNKTQGGFVIHFPSSESRRSLIVIPHFTCRDQKENKAKLHTFSINNGLDIILHNVKLGIQDRIFDDGQMEMLKIVMGMSLYLDAFPDYCKEIKGSFAGIKETQGNKRLITLNSDAKEFTERKSSPHWRRGHFRMLNSDRFIKKRGMIVFIKGTFVKGKSYLVTDQELNTEAVEISSL